jgi:hypothetical protein
MRSLQNRIDRIVDLMNARLDRLDETGYDLRSTAYAKLNASNKRWTPIEARLLMGLEFEAEIAELYVEADTAIQAVEDVLNDR